MLLWQYFYLLYLRLTFFKILLIIDLKYFYRHRNISSEVKLRSFKHQVT